MKHYDLQNYIFLNVIRCIIEILLCKKTFVITLQSLDLQTMITLRGVD